MSTTDPATDSPADRHDPPTFNLEYRFDDPENPEEVTVFPLCADADITTEWITVGTTDALPVREMR
jgi:hypothetical protein